MSARNVLFLSVGIGLALQSAMVAAQAAEQTQEPASTQQQGAEPAADPSQQPTTLGAVVVQARKREESFFEVPIVANVITKEALDRTKIDDMFSMATRVPSLLLGNGVGPSGAQVSMRGIGTTSLNPTMDNSISLNVDGLTLSQGTAYWIGMFDVEQIEVLKGPQALFYGKNNTAGIISLRSADPTDRFEAIARVGYEYEAEEKQADLILSGPVSDTLKLRLAVRHSDQEGFFKNEAVAIPGLGGRTPDFDNYAPTRNWVVRGTALWEPSDRLTARFKLNYSEYRLDGGSALANQVTFCPDGTAPVPPGNVPFLQGEDCRADRVIRRPWFDLSQFPAGLPSDRPFEKNAQTFGTLELDYRLNDDLSLVSVTGYYDSDYYNLFAGTTSSTAQAIAPIFILDNRQVTQEVRLVSDFLDKPVNFMVGGFFMDGKQSHESSLPTASAFGLPPLLSHFLGVVDIRSVSVFGQVIWDITPNLELAAGARWTDEERTHTQFNYMTPTPVQTPLLVPRLSSSNLSPEVSLTYRPTPQLTVFGSYKSGFKSGSFNTQTFTAPDRDVSFNDEEVKGGEAGVRLSSVDRRLTGSVAAYHYKYDDLQVGALELQGVSGGIVAVRTLNAASAIVQGLEFEGAFYPASIDGLSLNAAVNYNHARYDSFPNAPCGNGQTIAQGCNQFLNPATGRYTAQDYSGRRLVRAPDWSAYVGFDRQVALGNNLTLSYGAGANYVSEYTAALIDLPGFQQDAFVKYDANIALKESGGRWEIALIGRNLGNEMTVGRCANDNAQNGGILGGQISGAEVGGPAGQDEASCNVERGRQVWARFTWRF